MQTTSYPLWEWIFIMVTIVPSILALAFFMLREFFGPKPRKTIQIDNVTIELWVKERKFPAKADCIVVPVAPDLKMVTGIAKMVRDATANKVQADADAVAPLPAGDAFISGARGKYRFKMAALAVVMDDAKRSTRETISGAIKQALTLAVARDASSCMVPDMTEDLLRQPNWISDEQRRETCRPIASAMVDGILAGSEGLETVRIWVWRTMNEDIFLAELAALENRSTEVWMDHLLEGA